MRYLIPLFLSIVAAAEGTPRGKTEVERFETTVTAVTHFKQFSGSVKVLARDPRFVFALKNEHGAAENYAIHSIAQFFGDENETSLVGKRYTFVRTRILKSDGTLLKIELVVDRVTNPLK